jgi:hypothetical protein
MKSARDWVVSDWNGAVMSIQLSIVVGAGVMIAGTANWLLRNGARRLGRPPVGTSSSTLRSLSSASDTSGRPSGIIHAGDHKSPQVTLGDSNEHAIVP